MNNSTPAIACTGLQKQYNDGPRTVNVLRNVNLSIARGERVAILGPSGCGKSTLLHLLGGLDTPKQGTVLVGGQCITTANERTKSRMRNQYLGFVYQFHHLLPEFSALENVAMPLLIQGVAAKQALARAEVILGQVELADRIHHRLGQMSGGERQRTAVARALVTRPLCVLADEPTGNLDQRTANTVYDLMLKLNQEYQTSFLIVTHDVHFAARMDRVLVLQDGEIHER
jgi:lipoprotein-releasing system ATP-binding protein